VPRIRLSQRSTAQQGRRLDSHHLIVVRHAASQASLNILQLVRIWSWKDWNTNGLVSITSYLSCNSKIRISDSVICKGNLQSLLTCKQASKTRAGSVLHASAYLTGNFKNPNRLCTWDGRNVVHHVLDMICLMFLIDVGGDHLWAKGVLLVFC